MQIRVKSITGKSLKLQVDSFDTIDTVKYKIEDIVEISKENLKLIHKGKEPEDDRTCYFYNIQSDSKLFVALNLRGGMQIIRKLPYKEFVIFNLKLKDHQLQVNSFIKSNFP